MERDTSHLSVIDFAYGVHLGTGRDTNEKYQCFISRHYAFCYWVKVIGEVDGIYNFNTETVEYAADLFERTRDELQNGKIITTAVRRFGGSRSEPIDLYIINRKTQTPPSQEYVNIKEWLNK